MSRNRSFFSIPSGFCVTMRTGVVRVAGSSMSPTYDTTPWNGSGNDELRSSTLSPTWIGFEILVVDVSLHPDGGGVADHERDRGAGLNELARQHHLLHHGAGQRRPHHHLRSDRHVLLFRLGDVGLHDAVDLQGLQRGLQVGGGIVVVGLSPTRSRAPTAPCDRAGPCCGRDCAWRGRIGSSPCDTWTRRSSCRRWPHTAADRRL